MFEFNEETFMQTAYSEVGSTKFPIVPVGSNYTAVSKKPKTKKIEFTDNQTQEKRTVIVLVIPWEIRDPGFVPILGKDTGLVNQEFWLDLKADGALDLSVGKNVKLNQLIDTFKLPKPWTPKLLEGKLAKVEVDHRVDSKTSDVFSFVKAAVPL
jgi:hypothetical protein